MKLGQVQQNSFGEMYLYCGLCEVYKETKEETKLDAYGYLYIPIGVKNGEYMIPDSLINGEESCMFTEEPLTWATISYTGDLTQIFNEDGIYKESIRENVLGVDGNIASIYTFILLDWEEEVSKKKTTQIKIITSRNTCNNNFEEQVNTWLLENNDLDIIDIKFSATKAYIIYETRL